MGGGGGGEEEELGGVFVDEDVALLDEDIEDEAGNCELGHGVFWNSCFWQDVWRRSGYGCDCCSKPFCQARDRVGGENRTETRDSFFLHDQIGTYVFLWARTRSTRSHIISAHSS